MDTNSQLDYLRQQSNQKIGEYELQLRQAQNQIQQLTLHTQANSAQAQELAKKNEEINQWKQKYEALAKLYAQLRKEHLDLLTKFKATKDSTSQISEDARKRIEKIQADLKAKANELTEVLVERNRLKADADKIRLQYESEVARLKQELNDSKSAINEISQSRGTEVQSLVSRFTEEQSKLESLLGARQAEIDILTRQLGDIVSAMEKSKIVFVFN